MALNYSELSGSLVVTGSVTASLGFSGSFSGSFDIDEATLNHDNLSGFVANEHIDHSGVSITGINGLTGGGDITTSRTITLDGTSAYFTASVESVLASHTGSFASTTSVQNIIDVTGSFATTSSIGSFATTSSVQNILDVTGSFATTGSNAFTDVQHIKAGGLVIGAAGMVTGSNGYSIAAGLEVSASGGYSIAGGVSTEATANAAFAMGSGTKATAASAFAIGASTRVDGEYSFAAGNRVSASGDFQAALGHYNIPNSDSIVIIGDGTSDTRSNVLDIRTGEVQVTGSQVITGSLVVTGSVEFTGSLFVSGAFSGSSIYVGGGITAGDDITAFYSSDENLKDNVELIPNAVEKVKQIKGVSFDWNDKSKHSGHDVGVIAQDIEKVLPELVVTRENGFKAVKYDKLVALLIQVNKELIERIEKLESK